VVGMVPGGEATALQLEFVQVAGGGGEGAPRGLLAVVVGRTFRGGDILRTESDC
jgi:hypothetical protein